MDRLGTLIILFNYFVLQSKLNTLKKKIQKYDNNQFSEIIQKAA